MEKVLRNPFFVILFPALVGLAGGWFSVKGLEQYGWTLFLGLPALVAFLSAFSHCYRRERSFGETYAFSLFSLLALGGFILLFAIDGLICLLMALPLAALIALPGMALGRKLGSSLGPVGGATVSTLLCLAFPLFVSFEHAAAPQPGVRKVTTTVDIDASIEEVWACVVAFPRIEEPPRGLFRLGIAYPIEARIDGEGVGAIRYCTFSTGDFVEPITTWDEPNLLQFDVVENPPPMRELSPHPDLQAAHLHGHMVSRQGQFRLTEKDGRVELEGTTWYTHSLSPEIYWGMISDEIIHRIHLRVLHHIRRHSEATGVSSIGS